MAATTSFAQSSVTLSGNIDFAYTATSGNSTNASTKLNTVSQSNTASTSAINFAVLEDLGGGLRAEGRYEFDPRGLNNGTGINAGGTLGRHQAFVGLSGGFGALKLGAMNAASLQAYLASSPLGTGIGSAFTSSDHEAVATAGTVRYNNSLRYDTPNFNGFSASVTHAPGNDDATTGGARPAITNIGLSYSNGPLNVVFSSLQASATVGQAAATTNTCANPTAPNLINFAGCTTGTAAVTAGVKSTFNYIGANYTVGAARLFAGYGDGNKSANGADAKVTRVGASYTMGAVTLIGQYATTKIGTAADRKTTGLRADYALSKRTVAYAGYEAYDSGATTANKRNIAAFGVRHSF